MAFADDADVSRWSLESTEEIALTESVQRSSSEHEEVTFDLIYSFVIFVSELIRSDEHPKTANADKDTLTGCVSWKRDATDRDLTTYSELSPGVLGPHEQPRKEHT